jgi:hypothetical protein
MDNVAEPVNWGQTSSLLLLQQDEQHVGGEVFLSLSLKPAFPSLPRNIPSLNL